MLEQADTWSKHHFLCRHRLRCLGYVHLTNDDRILKDIMYGELIIGHNPAVRRTLRFKDVLKRYLKLTGINYGSEMFKESGMAGQNKINCWRSENNAGKLHSTFQLRLQTSVPCKDWTVKSLQTVLANGLNFFIKPVAAIISKDK